MNNKRRANGHEGKSFCLTLITPVNKIVVSDIKCHQLGDRQCSKEHSYTTKTHFPGGWKE